MSSPLKLLFSKLAKEIDSAPIKKGKPEEWTNYLRNRGVKQEELQNFEQRAINDANYPADRLMTKEEAAEQFRVLGDVPVMETRLGRIDDSSLEYANKLLKDPDSQFRPTQDPYEVARIALAPKYGSEYSLKGAPEHAYEELVLHSPWADELSSDPSHYTNIPGGDKNIAWLRYHLRQLEGDQPQNLFHLDELQSNRHQRGQKFGYQSDFRDQIKQANKILARKDEIQKQIKELPWEPDKPKSELQKSLEQEFDQLVDQYKQMSDNSILYRLSDYAPYAPFKGDSWKNLGLRRALLEAANRGADLFSWTTGKMQQDRWSGNAGDATSRFYDKYIPNQIRKDLKEHGVGDESFYTSISTRGKDIKELPMPMAHLLAKDMFEGEAEDYVRLFDDIFNSPSEYIRHFESIGVPRSVAKNSVDEVEDFIDDLLMRTSHMSPEYNQEIFDKAIMDFAPNVLFNTNNAFSQNLPAVRLTPEVRKSILEKGFPKYMLPLGGIGSGLTDEFADGIMEEPQEFAAGGLVWPYY